MKSDDSKPNWQKTFFVLTSTGLIAVEPSQTYTLCASDKIPSTPRKTPATNSSTEESLNRLLIEMERELELRLVPFPKQSSSPSTWIMKRWPKRATRLKPYSLSIDSKKNEPSLLWLDEASLFQNPNPLSPL